VLNILMWNERLMHHEKIHHLNDPEEQLSGYAKLKDRFKGLLSGW